MKDLEQDTSELLRQMVYTLFYNYGKGNPSYIFLSVLYLVAIFIADVIGQNCPHRVPIVGLRY
jgi:hypothetical protein